MSLDSSPAESSYVPESQQSEGVDQTCPRQRMVILQPIVMRIPNSRNVYSPSRLRPKKEISYNEFLAQYANQARGIRICFEETPSPATIFQRSELITAYSFGLDCWYIVEDRRAFENDLPEK